MNASHIRNNFMDDNFNQGRLINPMVGFVPQYSITDKLKFNVSLQFSPKGLKLIDSDSKWRYTYIDILPEIEYKVFKNVSIGLGMNFGFLQKEETKSNDEEWRSIKFLENTNTKDYGLIFKIQTQIKDVYFNLRCNYGLGDLTDITILGSSGNNIQEINQFNQNFQIAIGYTFRRCKK